MAKPLPPRIESELAGLRAAAIRRALGQAARNVAPDADGRFTCEDLNPGRYRARLLAWSATDRTWTEIASASVMVESGRATTVRFARGG